MYAGLKRVAKPAANLEIVIDYTALDEEMRSPAFFLARVWQGQGIPSPHVNVRPDQRAGYSNLRQSDPMRVAVR